MDPKKALESRGIHSRLCQDIGVLVEGIIFGRTFLIWARATPPPGGRAKHSICASFAHVLTIQSKYTIKQNNDTN